MLIHFISDNTSNATHNLISRWEERPPTQCAILGDFKLKFLQKISDLNRSEVLIEEAEVLDRDLLGVLYGFLQFIGLFRIIHDKYKLHNDSFNIYN